MNNDGENVADICLIEAEEKKSENGENRWEKKRQRSVHCGDHRHKQRTPIIIEALFNSFGVGNKC